MFYHFGFILVLAAVAHGQSTRPPHFKEKTNKYTKIAASPATEVTPKLLETVSVEETVTEDENAATAYKPIYDPKTNGNRVIIGYEPIYGTKTEEKLVIIGYKPIYEYTTVGDRVITGYDPIYGYLDKQESNEDLFRIPKDWNFVCPKRFGYFRFEGRGSCDIYIECRNYESSLKVCPDGMHFKNNPRWSEYPCAYPPEAQCLVREGELPARPTAECPHQFGNFPITGFEYTRYDQCSKYISCASGIAHVMNCTFGLVFNPLIQQCDWPEKVPGCHDVFEFHCPGARIGEENMVINYRYPSDPECRYFYSCLNGEYRVLACDEGLLFNHRIGRCVEYDEFVCDFEARLPPVPKHTSEENKSLL